MFVCVFVCLFVCLLICVFVCLLFGWLQRDWMTATFGGINHNLTIVTASATLGAEAAAHAINLSKPKMVISDTKLLKVLLPVLKDCPCLKTLITMSETDDETREAVESSGCQVKTFEQVVEIGKATQIDLSPPKSDDLAIIMFTSGTTATPKGVKVLHQNVVAASAGARQLLEPVVSENDVFSANLPLAHIMEILTEINVVAFGVAIGNGSPHTLTDNSVKVSQGQSGDLTKLKPSPKEKSCTPINLSCILRNSQTLC